MTLLAPLALSVCCLCPQGDEKPAPEKAAPQSAPKLSATEQQKMAGLAAKWFEAWLKWDNETDPKDRDRARQAARKAEEAFRKEWDGKDSKHNILSSIADLRTIFNGVFPYKNESATGELKTVAATKDGRHGFGLVVPKTYRATTAHRYMLLISGILDEEKKRWAVAKDHFDQTWKGSELVKDTVFGVPMIGEGVELDPQPDLQKETEEALEQLRITNVLSVVGPVIQQYNLDRDRMLIDCGKGASGFGLRLATYFPNRFAGIILRHPVDVGKLRLDSLAGVPVLLLSSKGTEAAAAKLAETLNGFAPGSARVLEGKGSYPFTESTAEIAAWAKDVKRELFKSKVVVVPNHNHPFMQSAFWLQLGGAELLHSVAEKDRPMVVAEADRAQNRITIQATSVAQVVLRLNDALVDLDKEVTIVVNGNAEKRKFQRDLNTLTNFIKTNLDPGFLFTCTHVTTAKKAAAPEPPSKQGQRQK
jgi:hypothetical protein